MIKIMLAWTSHHSNFLTDLRS